ncbi:hypothetical protein A4M15_22845 [Salmonella enterica subsp. enterica serovar Kingabwa]|nr:hypothetical protein [Salmonella enterica subsp. enterica serovar Kingabwa]
MRKHKGDVTYYLEKESGNYRLIKKLKARSKNLTKDGNKTTKVILTDLVLSESELLNIDFTYNGLRSDDEKSIRELIAEFKKNENK